MQLKTKNAQFVAACAATAALILAGSKLILFLTSGSLLIALSAWDSTIDVIVSLVNRQVIRFARTAADENHPYGHGKAESIAALGQGALIAGGAMTILVSSLRQIFFNSHEPSLVEPLLSTVQIILFFVAAALLSSVVAFSLKYYGKKYNSPALLADAAHYSSDIFSNGASAIGLALVTLTGNIFLDPIIAALLSLYLGFTGTKLILDSINDLMDQDVPHQVKESLQALVMSCSPHIIDIHKLRGRRSGHRYFFDFHVTLTDSLSLIEAHEIIDRIEAIIEKEFDADAVIHADPLMKQE